MRGRWVDLVWLLAVGVASSAWCVTAAARLGATFDEPFHMKAGLERWRTGSNKLLMKAGNMPLPVESQTLPVYLWERWRGEQFDPVADLHTILPVARAANLFWWWLLLVYAMRLGRTFGGTWGGRLAFALVACDPNLLGHAALATTDIPSAACMLVLIYHFYHCYQSGASLARRVLVPGVLYGLALLAKASALPFGPQAMLVIALWNLARAGALTAPASSSLWAKGVHLWHATYQFRKDIILIGLIGMVVVFGYCGSDWAVEPSFIKWANRLPEGDLKRAMVPVSHELKIFPNAGEAILNQIKHNMRGHGTFLLGQWHSRATPVYFPLALSMKVPLPVFVLLLAALVAHPRRLLLPTGGVALLLLAFTPNCRVQIGVRFVFLMMILTYITVAAAIANGWAARDARAVPRWLVAALVAAVAGASVWVWPHGLSYFNQAWGGPDAGRDLLHDSNYDWGQGAPDLRAWNAAHNGNEPLSVWYFGADPEVGRAPLALVNLSWAPSATAADVPAHVPTNLLAVNVGLLNFKPNATPMHAVARAWVLSRPEVARTRHFVIVRVRD
ncbi:MAG: hypothetical protein FJ304_11525 [Planctomycetes bacterium]|nr:hypothetical protein [Planctomycetota bacterium]